MIFSLTNLPPYIFTSFFVPLVKLSFLLSSPCVMPHRNVLHRNETATFFFFSIVFFRNVYKNVHLTTHKLSFNCFHSPFFLVFFIFFLFWFTSLLRYNNILYVYGSTDVRLHCNSNVCHECLGARRRRDDRSMGPAEAL